MRILSLNCQKDYNLGLPPFLTKTLAADTYDILLLQEVTRPVLELLANSKYSVLNVFDEQVRQQSELAIAYRPALTFRSHQFLSFATLRPEMPIPFNHAPFGALLGILDYAGDTYAFCSMHLDSGIRSSVRVLELMRLKQFLPKDVPVLFAGDFNFGLPGELSRAARLLAPDFHCATRRLGGTLDSRYSEYANHLPNKIARIGAVFGLGVKLRADHFFTNALFSRGKSLSCRILPDRVSDHSPIELVTSAQTAK